jgi:Zn-dependent protease with chaperone function
MVDTVALFAAVTDDPIAAARAMLPPAATWASALLVLPLAFVVSLLSTLIGLLFPLRHLRKAKSAPWWERARHAQPARIAAILGLVFMPGLAAMLAGQVGPLSRISNPWLVLLAALGAFLGAAVVRVHVERRVVQRHVSFLAWARDVSSFGLVLGGNVLFPAFGLVVAALIPGERVWVATLLAACGMVLALAGAGRWIARAIGLLRPPSPRILAIVERAASSVGVRPRRVSELRWSMTNALAWPRVGEIAFTSGALESLTDDDLVAICSHELGHLKETRAIIITRMALGALLAMPFVFMPLLAATTGVWGFLGIGLYVFVAQRVRSHVSIRLEQRADATAHEHQVADGDYARALERLTAANVTPAVLGARTTHPEVYDRLVAAGVSPSFARPARPPRARAVSAVWLSMAIAAGLSIGTRMFLDARSSEALDEGPIVTAIAFDGGDAYNLARLALMRAERGDVESALVLYRAAAFIEGDNPYFATESVLLLARAGRCEEAEHVLDEAEALEREWKKRRSPTSGFANAHRMTAKCRADVGVGSTSAAPEPPNR